jgi:hypothetical protein
VPARPANGTSPVIENPKHYKPVWELLMKALFVIPSAWSISFSVMAADNTFKININRAERTLKFHTENANIKMTVSVGSAENPTPTGCYSVDRIVPIAGVHDDDFTGHVGNYVIFFESGYALQGTTKTESIGKKATHGSVVMGITEAKMVYDIVKAKGLENTKICIK